MRGTINEVGRRMAVLAHRRSTTAEGLAEMVSDLRRAGTLSGPRDPSSFARRVTDTLKGAVHGQS